MTTLEGLNDVQKKIFAAIVENSVDELKKSLAQLQGTADFVDENGMTPLQHACYRGSTEFVQLLLDQVRVVKNFAFNELESKVLRLCQQFIPALKSLAGSRCEFESARVELHSSALRSSLRKRRIVSSPAFRWRKRECTQFSKQNGRSNGSLRWKPRSRRLHQ